MLRITTKNLTVDYVQMIIDKANSFSWPTNADRVVTQNKTDQQKTIGMCFFENSTRTKLSFELAAKKLGYITLDLNPETSSLNKGESQYDTLKTMENLGCNALIVRTSSNTLIDSELDGIGIPIISAGQGSADHPSQGLLDAYTVIANNRKQSKSKEKLPRETTVTLVGDIKHSRVSASNIRILSLLGIKIGVLAPETLHLSDYPPTVQIFDNKQQAIANSDYLMPLRIQRERFSGSISQQEINNLIGDYRIQISDFNDYPEKYILHPGPVNWGVELDVDMKQFPNSLIETQVANGVAVRMAMLHNLFS